MKNLFYLLSMVLLALTVGCNEVDNLVNPTTQNSVNVYVAGQKNEQACYWKNNQLTMLNSGTFSGSESIKIIESNGDVYVLGRAYPSGGSNYGVNLLWKNGVLTNLNALYFNQTSNNALIIDDIDVVGNDVYLVGYTKDWSTGAFSLKTWKNNIATDLLNTTTTNVFNNPCSIKFLNNNVYVTTPDGGIYVNNVFQSVSVGILLKGLAVKDNQVYVYGANTSTNTGFYKNLATGVETNVGFPSNDDLILLCFDNDNMYYSYNTQIYKNGTLFYELPPVVGITFPSIQDFIVLNNNLYKIIGGLSINQTIDVNGTIVQTSSSGENFKSLYIVHN